MENSSGINSQSFPTKLHFHFSPTAQNKKGEIDNILTILEYIYIYIYILKGLLLFGESRTKLWVLFVFSFGLLIYRHRLEPSFQQQTQVFGDSA